MATLVMPLRRIRIHRQRGFNQWAVYCPCCWLNHGTGIPSPMDTFDQATAWTALHIAAKHPRDTHRDNCTNSVCPECGRGQS